MGGKRLEDFKTGLADWPNGNSDNKSSNAQVKVKTYLVTSKFD